MYIIEQGLAKFESFICQVINMYDTMNPAMGFGADALKGYSHTAILAPLLPVSSVWWLQGPEARVLAPHKMRSITGVWVLLCQSRLSEQIQRRQLEPRCHSLETSGTQSLTLTHVSQ